MWKCLKATIYKMYLWDRKALCIPDKLYYIRDIGMWYDGNLRLMIQSFSLGSVWFNKTGEAERKHTFFWFYDSHRLPQQQLAAAGPTQQSACEEMWMGVMELVLFVKFRRERHNTTKRQSTSTIHKSKTLWRPEGHKRQKERQIRASTYASCQTWDTT